MSDMTKTARVLTFVICYIFYIIIGASIFAAVEGPRETTLKKDLHLVIENFSKETSACLSDDELERFIKEVVIAANRGVSANRNVTMSEPNWSFGQAIFFAFTILTTIGYGRVTPLSDAGKGFCMIYAIIGIPLTLVLFSALVERIMIPFKAILYFLFRRLGHLCKPYHIQLLHLLLVLLFLLMLFMLLPAAIYTCLEPTWNFLDALYYCFISLTTIGLGDYIPGDTINQPHRALYKVATTVYLLLGLLMMMTALSVLYEIPELNIGLHFYQKNGGPNEEQTSLNKSNQDEAALACSQYKKHEMCAQVSESSKHYQSLDERKEAPAEE